MKSTTPLSSLPRASAPRPALSRLVLALALACGPAVQASAAEAEAEVDGVGSVSLLIGQAWVVRSDGSQHTLQRGARVHVGDRIETSANGHVHMRFVDNAAVSVRPQSSLEVQAYHFDPRRPELHEVRLRVERGTSRSISGAATDADKTRFRLNTPIAAIGVRGTDFIVQADASSVRATVSDGAIAVGALGAGCSAAGLGPCAGAQELSADMGRLMAEVRANDQSTRLVPAVDLSVADAGNRRARSADGPGQSLNEIRALSMAAAEPSGLEADQGNDRAAAELLTLAKVRVPADLNLPTDIGAQLIWGRWSILADDNEKLSVPFALARLGRHVTVGDSQMGLFRADQSVPGELFSDDLQGTVKMNLNRASASYVVGGETQTAGISASNLTIDFTRRTFATALDLFSAGGVQGKLLAAGPIRADGLFWARDTEQTLSGALSLDGKEAGYLFERTAGDGVFRGRTLWGP